MGRNYKKVEWPPAQEIKQAIYRGVVRGDSVAQLELIGLSPRTIGVLEGVGVMTVEELISKKDEELLSYFGIKQCTLIAIKESLSRYPELENNLQFLHT